MFYAISALWTGRGRIALENAIPMRIIRFLDSGEFAPTPVLVFPMLVFSFYALKITRLSWHHFGSFNLVGTYSAAMFCGRNGRKPFLLLYTCYYELPTEINFF